MNEELDEEKMRGVRLFSREWSQWLLEEQGFRSPEGKVKYQTKIATIHEGNKTL